MVQYCVVPGCYSRAGQPETSFHLFPKNKELKMQWIVKIRRGEKCTSEVSKYMKVCSKHFKESDFKVIVNGVHKFLNDDAVPSIFSFTSRKIKPPRRKKIMVKGNLTKKQNSLASAVALKTSDSAQNSLLQPVAEGDPRHFVTHDNYLDTQNNVNNLTDVQERYNEFARLKMELLEEHSYATIKNRERSSNTYCSVPQCSNYKRAGISFHLFPHRREYLLLLWSQALKIGKRATKGMVVCGEHFKDEDYYQGPSAIRRRLKTTAIPSRKLPTPSPDRVTSKNQSQSVKNQKAQVEKRQKKAQQATIQAKTRCQEGRFDEPLISLEASFVVQGNKIANLAKKALLELRSAMAEEECLASQVPLRCDSANQMSMINPCHKMTSLDMLKTDKDLNAFTDSRAPIYVKEEPLEECTSIKQELEDREMENFEYDWGIKTENVEIPDYEYETESVESRIKPEKVDISDDNERYDKPDPLETVYVKGEPAEESTNAEPATAVDPLSIPLHCHSVSTRADRPERQSLPSTADTPDSTLHAMTFPSKSVLKELLMGSRKHCKKPCAPRRIKLTERDKRLNYIAGAEAEKHSVTESPSSTAKSFECDLCRAKFATKTSLAKHVTGFCFENWFPSSIAVESLVTNNKVVTLSGETFCCSCTMGFSDISELEQHVLHSSKRGCFIISCKFCSKVFNSVVGRDLHSLTHTGDQKYECKFCDNVFSHSSSRNRHSLCHIDEEKFECALCRKVFTDFGSRNRHMRSHGGRKKYECKYCQKLFTQSSIRNRHLRTHTGGKKYECKFCPKLFSHTSSRNRHMLTHRRRKD